jgi:potassium-transporting ATPase potassium-binding subunit
MMVTGWIQIVVLVAVLTLLTPLLGGDMARVYRRERVGLSYVLGPVERLLYRVLRVDPEEEQRWARYAGALLLFSAASWIALHAILRTQTDTPTFVIYLVGFVVIVAVLTFLTALVLAPFAQALSARMLG